MKILQLHTHYRQAGGEDVVVATEAELLREAGHEVRSLATANPDAGAQAVRRLVAAPWNPAAARRVRRAAVQLEPDVAHVHNTWYSLSPAVLAALRGLGIPVVMTLHNYRLICSAATLFRDGAPCRDCVGSHSGHAVAHRCYRDSTAASAVAAATITYHHARRTWHRDVDHFLALTEFGREQFVAGGLPPESISVKPNSVGDPGSRSCRPSASRTVVYVGRLSEEKGVTHLLAAWEKAPTTLDLVVVGSGPLEASLRASAPARVRFLGQQPSAAVAELLLGARAMVFPSVWYEGHPLVVLEAAAAGLPVLLSDLGAMTGMFAPDADELLVTPGEVTSLVRGFERLSDDAFVDRHGLLTRQRFEERYTHAVARTRLEEVYDRQLQIARRSV